MTLAKKIESHNAVVGVIGLGYVGLSLLEVFGRAGFSLIGFDKSTKKIEQLQKGERFYNFIPMAELVEFQNKNRFECSSDPAILTKADVIIICVSTPLDKQRHPDPSNLQQAFQTIGAHLKKNQLIVLQSTTYPGTTEEELLPLLEKKGMKVGHDFFLSYVPEISDPGNPHYAFSEVPRVISGVTLTCLKMAELLYKKIGCQVVSAPSTRVAEAAKILQNAYRMVNISFVNEMKIMFDRMGMDVWEVIDAAKVKPFGYTAFYPSMGAGGDCIPVVPLYLVSKAKETDGPTSMMELADAINTMIPHYVVEKVIQALNAHNRKINGAKILMLGVAYKKDVNDLRESAPLRVLTLLKEAGAEVYYNDPFVPELENVPKYPQLKMKSRQLDYPQMKSYDAVVIATNHSSYQWKEVVKHSTLIIDTQNVTTNIEGAKEKVVKA